MIVNTFIYKRQSLSLTTFNIHPRDKVYNNKNHCFSTLSIKISHTLLPPFSLKTRLCVTQCSSFFSCGMKSVGHAAKVIEATYANEAKTINQAQTSITPMLDSTIKVPCDIITQPYEKNDTAYSTFEQDLDIVQEEDVAVTKQEDEYSLTAINLSPDLRDGSNNPIPSHESSHIAIMKENHDTGQREYNLIFTSAAKNSVNKSINMEIDGLNISGEQKPQRVANLQTTRVLDVNVVEGTDYQINTAATAYMHQEHIYDKIDTSIKDRDPTHSVIRRSADSSTLYNTLGQQQEFDNTKDNFYEIDNNINDEDT